MSACIHYFCTSRHIYTLGIFAAYYAPRVGPGIRIIPYTAISAIRSFGPGAFIFTDFDRLTPRSRQQIGRLADHFRDSGRTVINHPVRSLRRFDLLRTLHDRGINAFAVYRLPDWQKVERFPVFIRHENQHGHALTGLLGDPAALRAAIEALPLGKRTDPNLMIVEFGNARGADGKYRKFAAFKVGERIYAQHCYASADWLVKFDSAGLNESEWREHDRFATDNPHRDQLEPIFAAAGIDYGRADYCVVDGRVQIFEINTNPTIVHARGWRSIDIGPYVRSHEEALIHLLATLPDSGDIENPAAKPSGRSDDTSQVHGHMLRLVRQRWEGPGANGAPERKGA